jgi:Domain of unknown function (DUF4157)
MKAAAQTRQTAPQSSPTSSRAIPPTSQSAVTPFFRMQRTLGNQAIAGLLASGRIQPKLRVSQSGDPDEIAADRMADRVLTSAPSGIVQRKCHCSGAAPCSKCKKEEPDQIQRQAAFSHAPPRSVPNDFIGSLGQGRPIDPPVRAFLEPRFGADFGNVRIYSDADAAKSAEAIQARAFTTGSHIVFNHGEYSPASTGGLRLLSHELAHVLQQTGAKRDGVAAAGSTLQRQGKDPKPSANPNFNPEDTVGSITVFNIAPRTAEVWMHKKTDGSSYPLVYTVTKSDLPEGKTYQGFKDASGRLRVKEKGKDYLLYFVGSPNPALLKFPPTFDVMVVNRVGPPASTGEGRGAGKGSAEKAAQGQPGVRVQVITAAQFEALTGKPARELPDGRFVPTGQVPQWNLGSSGALPGSSFAMVITPPPDLPLPEGAVGILWTGDHMSDFVVVNGRIIARGFRAGLVRQGLGALERVGPIKRILLRIGGPRRFGPFRFDKGMGPAGISLNEGVPGSYANDWLFPYKPGARAVYQLNPPPGAAENLLKSMEDVAPLLEGQTYRYSEPPASFPTPLKYRVGPNGCILGTSNCITLPSQVHEEGLGGENIVLNEGQYKIDVIRGSVLNPEAQGPGAASPNPELLKPGLASSIDEYVKQPEEMFTGQGLGVKPTAWPMWARGAAGVIRVGGTVLMVYSAAESTIRIAEATPEERPIVIGEEAGSWGGGLIGNVLASALGGAFFCAETGPGAFFCALGFGIAGGITGGVVGKSLGHDLAQTLVDVGKLTPAQWIQGSTLLFGTPEQKRALEQMREVETGEPGPGF